MGVLKRSGFNIGWEQTTITPENPVIVRGYAYVRVSEGVKDDLTATVLVLESADTCTVMVSCDLIVITDELRDGVRKYVQRYVPEMNAEQVVLNATHTHNGPEIRCDSDPSALVGFELKDLQVMDPIDYVRFASQRIGKAIRRAWERRRPGGISWGLSYAVVGYNRLASYYGDGVPATGAPSETPFSTEAVRLTPGGYSKMYGSTNDPDFSHIEGWSDHGLNVLYTWDEASELTGVIVNLACPSQVGGDPFLLSADFWHETRVHIRRRLGDHVHVLAQCQPAGDQNSRPLYRCKAEQRMLDLKGRTRREEIAIRLADGVEHIIPYMRSCIEWDPLLVHEVHHVSVPRRPITGDEVDQARREAARLKREHEMFLKKLRDRPDLKKTPRWYVEPSKTYWLLRRARTVVERYAIQKDDPLFKLEMHVIRLGDVGFATHPFEYYLDYGVQIQARSKAIQTFLIQLAGPGTYVATKRAEEGGAYGAVSASNVVGSRGGRMLADETVARLNALWKAEAQ